MYHLEYARSAWKELQTLPQNVIDRIENAIQELVDNPRPHGAIKLVGEDNLYRIRVGQYRVVYSIFEVTVTVLIVRVRHRKDA